MKGVLTVKELLRNNVGLAGISGIMVFIGHSIFCYETDKKDKVIDKYEKYEVLNWSTQHDGGEPVFLCIVAEEIKEEIENG